MVWKEVETELSCEVSASGQKQKHRQGGIDFSLLVDELVGQPIQPVLPRHEKDGELFGSVLQ